MPCFLFLLPLSYRFRQHADTSPSLFMPRLHQATKKVVSSPEDIEYRDHAFFDAHFLRFIYAYFSPDTGRNTPEIEKRRLMSIPLARRFCAPPPFAAAIYKMPPPRHAARDGGRWMMRRRYNTPMMILRQLLPFLLLLLFSSFSSLPSFFFWYIFLSFLSFIFLHNRYVIYYRRADEAPDFLLEERRQVV